MNSIVKIGGRALSPQVMLLGVLFLGLVLRLIFIGSTGFTNDVSSFESWTLSLANAPLRDFYAKAGFADYPPGYFFILWPLGKFYVAFVKHDPSWEFLKILVKVPAIVMDLVDAALVYAIVRRCASAATALAAAALFALNPAAIYISSYWGQVDSVALGFVLGALLLLIRAGERRDRGASFAIAGAWAFLTISILIKPPAAVLIPLLVAFSFVPRDPEVRHSRILGFGLGIDAALALSYLASLAFHPGWNPFKQWLWLFQRYQFGSNVYQYNSINAFNLHAIWTSFWQPDTVITPGWMLLGHTIGMPAYLWGIVLVVGAAILIVIAYTRNPTTTALLEAAMLLSFAFFILSTRMHERYIFNALVLMIVLSFAGRRYVFSSFILTLTLFGNLAYSLNYLHVMDAHTPGVDATNLIPMLSKPFALANVLLFFGLGYRFIAGAEIAAPADVSKIAGAGLSEQVVGVFGRIAAWIGKGRVWFTPREGLTAMTRLDYGIALGLTVASFVLLYANYWNPAEKIFDEIYYARAGAEYLKHIDIFEFTHPPLTKLIIAFSMMLFGGLAHGDNSWGWRFLNIVIGALTVFVCYAFAKRLSGSTLFAALAAGFLMFDGFHFTQSRIATPEITVAFFCLTTTYAFYRLWLASQVRRAPILTWDLITFEALLLWPATLVALTASYFLTRDQGAGARIASFLYFELGVYLLIRVIAPRLRRVPSMLSYPDGSVVHETELVAPDGGLIPRTQGAIESGAYSTVKKAGLQLKVEDLRIDYARNASVRYRTPEGEACFAEDGTITVDDERIHTRDARIWLGLFAVSCGLLAASKWNGLPLIAGLFMLVCVISVQRLILPAFAFIGNALLKTGGSGFALARRPALLGNPHGFSVDLVIGFSFFVTATIYLLSYIPYLMIGHNLNDVIVMQRSMYAYHADLVATHPYSSVWWQWPLLQIPVSYYWHDFRTGVNAQNPLACCVSEILALPNPVTFWLGLLSIPFLCVVGWHERRKSYLLLVTVYLFEWLPWALSPRKLTFEYHFFPNVAIIMIANALIFQRLTQWLFKLWNEGERQYVRLVCALLLSPIVCALGYIGFTWLSANRMSVYEKVLTDFLSYWFGATLADVILFVILAVFLAMLAWLLYACLLLLTSSKEAPVYTVIGAFSVLTLVSFAFFYPITAGVPLHWVDWDARMLTPLMNNMWINPHPGQ